MTVAAPAQPWVGRPLARAEDVRFTTGTSAFVGDLHFEGMLHAAFVRSWSAHARLVGIDAEAALAARGVVAVLTARDLDGRVGRFPVNPIEDGEAADAPHPVLARDRVRYVGEPVAVVVAETPDAAVDAAELVVVDLDELPALVDPRAALEADTQLHDAAPGNALLRWRKSAGDVDGAFAAAAHVARVSVRAPRLVASPLEPRGAVAAYDAADDLLTVHVSAQDPYRQLSGLCRVLDRPPERLRVVVPDVGGAFGSKGVPAAETAAVALAALELGRPVRWLETRTENFLSSYQGRGLEADAELALDGEGRMLALRARIVGDLGAYLYPTTPVAPVTAAMLLTGCYAIPAAEVEVVGAATNKVPTGPYRGAGRPEAALVLERLVDVAARELGVDPVELRRRNLIPADAFPYETPLGFTYDSGDYARALDTALELAAYARVREDQEAARRGGRLVGVGVALYVERCGPGSETAAVRVEPGGRVVCRTGSSPHGQGHETTFAQIAADALGVDPVHVEIRWGDSQALPHGTGTFASRSVAVGGSALLLAAQRVKEQWEEARRAAGRDLSLAEAAPLDADARFELSGPVFSSGAYVAVVEVEPDTGEVTVRSIAAVDDCGRVVNPLLAEGQVVGAAVQAIGECLYEEVGYDERGQPLAVNLYDYHLPTAFAVPPIASALLETPSPLNPLGAKGVGEGGSIGTPAAIANAVADALAPLGVRHADLPFTPARVWKVIETASTNRSGADHEAD